MNAKKWVKSSPRQWVAMKASDGQCLNMVSCSTSSPVVLTLLDRTLVHRPRIPSQQCWYSFAAECKLSQIWLFRDLRRGTTPRCPLSGCLSSVACRVRSVRLAIALLMSGGAIPATTGRLLVFVGSRHPVIILQVSFSVASSLFAWVERSHTGQAYSSTGHNAYVFGETDFVQNIIDIYRNLLIHYVVKYLS